MIYYYDFEQCSDEWFEFRKDKLTGSNATPIAADGAGLKTYCKNIAMKLSEIKDDPFINADMERGNELESIAISAYELQKGLTIKKIGCITNSKYERVSISPDGLISDDGGCEVKARNNMKHYSLIQGEKKEIPSNQIQMCLLVSERKWWDFISINVNFSNPLFIERVYPDLMYFEKLKKGFKAGIILIDEYVNNYNEYKL